MTALRWTRRALDALLVVAVLAAMVTATLQLLAPLAGGRTLVIGGGSMEPAIGRGAFVLTLPAGPEGYAVGDVVTIQQGGATPYTHRITRLAEVKGVAYVETRGDANAAPDPALVPTAAVTGRIAMNVPLLGYVALLLGTAAGLAGFLAVCAAALFLIWLLEDLEERDCLACRGRRDWPVGEPGPSGRSGPRRRRRPRPTPPSSLPMPSGPCPRPPRSFSGRASVTPGGLATPPRRCSWSATAVTPAVTGPRPPLPCRRRRSGCRRRSSPRQRRR
jgi:signal peptidase